MKCQQIYFRLVRMDRHPRVDLVGPDLLTCPTTLFDHHATPITSCQRHVRRPVVRQIEFELAPEHAWLPTSCAMRDKTYTTALCQTWHAIRDGLISISTVVAPSEKLWL